MRSYRRDHVGPGDIRPPAVAGRFYPADPDELRSTVKALLNQAPTAGGSTPKAILVPHAGYLFSGTVAAAAYAELEPGAERIRRVVLIGPAHFVPFEGIAASTASAFRTPLGDVPVDTAAIDALRTHPGVALLDEPHAPEHSLEVQLPFLQFVLPEFKILPLLVGETTAAQVSHLINTLWDGPETCFVLSSDLSHYLDYAAANRLDRLTAQAIAQLASEQIAENQACGRLPVCGFLLSAKARNLKVRTIQLRNSGDAGGPQEGVVGYGAFSFREALSCPS